MKRQLVKERNGNFEVDVNHDNRTKQEYQSLFSWEKKHEIISFRGLFDMYYAMLINKALNKVKEEEIAQKIVVKVFRHVWENQSFTNTQQNIESDLIELLKKEILMFYCEHGF